MFGLNWRKRVRVSDRSWLNASSGRGLSGSTKRGPVSLNVGADGHVSIYVRLPGGLYFRKRVL